MVEVVDPAFRIPHLAQRTSVTGIDTYGALCLVLDLLPCLAEPPRSQLTRLAQHIRPDDHHRCIGR